MTEYVIERTEGGERFRLGPDYHLGFPYWFGVKTSGWYPYVFESVQKALAFMDNDPFADFDNAEVMPYETR